MLEKLPCNIDDEKRILGSMLRSSNAAIDGCGALEEEDFINRKHQIIFNAIRNVHNNNQPVNVTNVSNELVNLKQFDNIGGINYLTELTDSVISVSSYKTYIDHVKEQSVFRAYLLELKKTIESYDNNGVTDISDFIGRSTEAIRQKAESRKISDFVHIKDYTKSVTNDLITMRNYASSNGLTGVDTGYTRLNQLTHGFQKTEMIILAARPSVGKTALGINIALNVAKKSNVPVGIFSLEMDASKITQRMIGALGCVDQGRLATGQVTSRDMAAIQTACDKLSKMAIYIDDSPNAKLSDILAKARKLKQEQPDLGLIMVDYIGLISSGNQKMESRQVEVASYSRALKALAREIDCPVLVLCQLSRYDKGKTGVRSDRAVAPTMSDLRESGQIEQDADVIMLLHNDYDLQNSTNMHEKIPAEEVPTVNQNGDIASLLHVNVAKNRNGAVGRFDLIFTKSNGCIDNQAKTEDEEF